MVEETEEEGEDEEDGLEYVTDTPSGDSYMTPLSTGGRSQPSPALSPSSTLEGSDPETNAVLHTVIVMTFWYVYIGTDLLFFETF